MNFFEDRKIKKIARDEDIKAPDKYLKSVEQTLNDLKNNEEKIKPIWSNIRKFNYAIAMEMLMFVLLTNVSPKFAYAMQELPIIGDIVKVITIRNYFDKDGNSEIEMEIPNIKNDNNSQSQTNENVNEDVNQLTQKILDKFYAEKNSEKQSPAFFRMPVTTGRAMVHKSMLCSRELSRPTLKHMCLGDVTKESGILHRNSL